MFKVGDKVKRRNGRSFSDGSFVQTVKAHPEDKVYGIIPYAVWLKETDSWIGENDLVLANPSPVRETTIVKKEIVPGTYGDVKIEAWDNGYVFDCAITMKPVNKKDKLAEAIKTLQLIHDAME